MVYTYDADAVVLYVLVVDENNATIDRTEEIGPNLHVDLDASGSLVGVEFLYPRSQGIDTVTFPAFFQRRPGYSPP